MTGQDGKTIREAPDWTAPAGPSAFWAIMAREVDGKTDTERRATLATIVNYAYAHDCGAVSFWTLVMVLAAVSAVPMVAFAARLAGAVAGAQ